MNNSTTNIRDMILEEASKVQSLDQLANEYFVWDNGYALTLYSQVHKFEDPEDGEDIAFILFDQDAEEGDQYVAGFAYLESKDGEQEQVLVIDEVESFSTVWRAQDYLAEQGYTFDQKLVDGFDADLEWALEPDDTPPSDAARNDFKLRY